MYTFDGIKFVNQHNDESFAVGDKFEKVQSVLRLPDDMSKSLNDSFSYFSVDEVMFGELSGKCKMSFYKESLFRIEFTPSLKEYLCESKEVTREVFYNSVFRAYKYICNSINQNGYVPEESKKRYSTYLINEKRLSISIDRDCEAVCVIQEEIHV